MPTNETAETDVKRVAEEVTKQLAKKFELSNDKIVLHLNKILTSVEILKPQNNEKKEGKTAEKNVVNAFDVTTTIQKDDKFPHILKGIKGKIEELVEIAKEKNKQQTDSTKNLVESIQQKAETPKRIPTPAGLGEFGIYEAPRPPKKPSLPAGLGEFGIFEAERKPSFIEKDKEQKVKVTDFTGKALDDVTKKLPESISSKLKPWFGRLTDSFDKFKKKITTSPGSDKSVFDLPGMGILKGALSVLSLFGGIVTLVYGLEQSGPLKGLTKIIGTGMLKFSLKELLPKMFATLGPKLLKNLKFLPGIGAIISLGYAYSRFKSGDYVGGGLDILSGVVSLIPGIGTGFAIGIDALNAFLDLQAGGSGEEASKKKEKMAPWMGKFVKMLAIPFKKVPLIGTIVGLGMAFLRFKNGQWVRGGLELLSGIASLIPGLGTAVSFGIDAIIALIDAADNGEETKVAETSAKKENPFEAFKKMIMEKARKWWKGTWDWIKWLARKILPENVIKFLDTDKPTDTKEITPSTSTPSASPAQKLPEGIKSAVKETSPEAAKALTAPTIAAPSQTSSKNSIGTREVPPPHVPRREVPPPHVPRREVPPPHPIQPTPTPLPTRQPVPTPHREVPPPHPIQPTPTPLPTRQPVPTTSQIASSPEDSKKALDKIKVEQSKARAELLKQEALKQGKDTSHVSGLVKGSQATLDNVSEDQDVKHINEMINGLQNAVKALQESNQKVIGPSPSPAPPLKPEADKTSADASMSSAALQNIANNTRNSNETLFSLANGFNLMAKAIEKVGSAVGEKVNVPPVVVNNSAPQQAPTKKVSTTELAKQGNPTIAQVRATMENLRPIPA